MLGRKLQMAREMKGETLRSLAEKSGVSNPLISQIESGKTKDPGFATVVRFEETVLDYKSDSAGDRP